MIASRQCSDLLYFLIPNSYFSLGGRRVRRRYFIKSRTSFCNLIRCGIVYSTFNSSTSNTSIPNGADSPL